MMCDTWVALPDTTTTQNVIFAKNSDRPIFDCQPLILNQRREWEAGNRIQLEYMRLPQVETTYNSFIIADSSEAWVLEAAGRRWVAKRYTSGYTSISGSTHEKELN